MKPAVLIAAALIGVGALLYLAFDPQTDRGGERGAAASGEARREEPAARLQAESGPEETVGVHVVVRPAGIADIVLTGPRSWRGRTDEDGKVFAGRMKPGRYAVSARRESMVAATSFTVEGETTVELRLEEGFAVRGHVYDASGRPIAGARVQATPESERTGVHRGWRISWLAANSRPPVHAESTTDENGAYTLFLHPDQYTLEARAAGFAGANERARHYGKQTEGIDFHLQPGAPVSGRVVDCDENPVGGALVVITGGRSVTTLTETGPDGAFSTDVPVTGWKQLAVRAYGYAPMMYGRIHPPVSGLTIRIDRGAVAQARLVIAGTGGQPAVGVEAYLSFSGGGRATTSDRDGIVRFPLISTRSSFTNWWNVMFAGGGFIPLMKPVQGKQPIDGLLDLGEIELKPGATIRGRVLDKATGAGIEGADVRWVSATLRGMTRSPVTGTTSDGEGNYELTGVPDDVVAVLALKQGYANELDQAAVWKKMREKRARLLAPGQMVAEHDVELSSATSVHGIAFDPEGNPLSGAVVHGPSTAMMAGVTLRPSAVSGEDGRFELPGYRSGRKIVLEARHQLYGTAEQVRLTTGGGEVTVEFRQPVRINGRVVDPNGEPIAHARIVAARPPKRGQPQYERNPPTAVTGSDGRFVLRTVPPEERDLQASHDLFLTSSRRLSLSGDLDVGEIRLERGPGIEGKVVDEDGRPVAGAAVAIAWDQTQKIKAEPTDRLYAQLSTGPDGRFATYGLRQGNYRVAAEVVGRFADRPLVATGTTDVVITMRTGKTWHGRVVAAGEPVKNAYFSATLPGQQSWIAGAMSSYDGTVSLQPLPPGSAFDLTVQHQDYKPFKLTNVTAASMPNEITLDPGAVIRGIVVDAEGRPVAQASIQGRPVDGKGSKWTQSKEDGTFVLSGLDANHRYSVHVNFTREHHVPGDPVEAEPGSEIRFELEAGSTIEGRIKTSDADELGNVRIIAIDAQGKQRATAWVFGPQSLAFKLSTLKKGTYTLRVLAGWGENEKVLAEVEGIETGSKDVEIRADG